MKLLKRIKDYFKVKPRIRYELTEAGKKELEEVDKAWESVLELEKPVPSTTFDPNDLKKSQDYHYAKIRLMDKYFAMRLAFSLKSIDCMFD